MRAAVTFVVVLASAAWAQAPADPAPSITLKQAVEIALERNPLVASRQSRASRPAAITASRTPRPALLCSDRCMEIVAAQATYPVETTTRAEVSER